MWLLLLGLFKFQGYTRTRELWGVPTQQYVFMDFRLIPGSAESSRRRFEPSIENPFEPGQRIFNYPAFWRLLFYTNITQDDTIWIGVLMLILTGLGRISKRCLKSIKDNYMNIHIRPALPEEADTLTQIALAAKHHWGYPACWMEIWTPQLTFSPDYFQENETWVAEVEHPIAFYTLQERDGNAWIENLWVLPEYMGQGVGKQLFLHAMSRSLELGYKILQLEADPNAVGFYEKMGMHKIGERYSEIEGQPRRLPIMEMKL